MSRFSFAALFIAASTSSASACCYFRPNDDKTNYRTGEIYSTNASSKADLTRPGVELYISPRDSFDFVPSSGHAVRGMGNLKESFAELAAARGGEIHDGAILKGSEDDVAEWVRALLGDDTDVQKYQAPRPNETLPGKVLTVEKAEEILNSKYVGDAVVCHKVEQDATFCHKLTNENFDVTEITVSPNGKPSTVWVGCHELVDEKRYSGCHVLNVGDLVFLGHTDKKVASKLLRQAGEE